MYFRKIAVNFVAVFFSCILINLQVIAQVNSNPEEVLSPSKLRWVSAYKSIINPNKISISSNGEVDLRGKKSFAIVVPSNGILKFTGIDLSKIDLFSSDGWGAYRQENFTSIENQIHLKGVNSKIWRNPYRKTVEVLVANREAKSKKFQLLASDFLSDSLDSYVSRVLRQDIKLEEKGIGDEKNFSILSSTEEQEEILSYFKKNTAKELRLLEDGVYLVQAQPLIEPLSMKNQNSITSSTRYNISIQDAFKKWKVIPTVSSEQNPPKSVSDYNGYKKSIFGKSYFFINSSTNFIKFSEPTLVKIFKINGTEKVNLRKVSFYSSALSELANKGISKLSELLANKFKEASYLFTDFNNPIASQIKREFYSHISWKYLSPNKGTKIKEEELYSKIAYPKDITSLKVSKVKASPIKLLKNSYSFTITKKIEDTLFNDRGIKISFYGTRKELRSLQGLINNRSVVSGKERNEKYTFFLRESDSDRGIDLNTKVRTDLYFPIIGDLKEISLKFNKENPKLGFTVSIANAILSTSIAQNIKNLNYFCSENKKCIENLFKTKSQDLQNIVKIAPDVLKLISLDTIYSKNLLTKDRLKREEKEQAVLSNNQIFKTANYFSSNKYYYLANDLLMELLNHNSELVSKELILSLAANYNKIRDYKNIKNLYKSAFINSKGKFGYDKLRDIFSKTGDLVSHSFIDSLKGNLSKKEDLTRDNLLTKQFQVISYSQKESGQYGSNFYHINDQSNLKFKVNQDSNILIKFRLDDKEKCISLEGLKTERKLFIEKSSDTSFIKTVELPLKKGNYSISVGLKKNKSLVSLSYNTDYKTNKIASDYLEDSNHICGGKKGRVEFIKNALKNRIKKDRIIKAKPYELESGNWRNFENLNFLNTGSNLWVDRDLAFQDRVDFSRIRSSLYPRSSSDSVGSRESIIFKISDFDADYRIKFKVNSITLRNDLEKGRSRYFNIRCYQKEVLNLNFNSSEVLACSSFREPLNYKLLPIELKKESYSSGFFVIEPDLNSVLDSLEFELQKKTSSGWNSIPRYRVDGERLKFLDLKNISNDEIKIPLEKNKYYRVDTLIGNNIKTKIVYSKTKNELRMANSFCDLNLPCGVQVKIWEPQELLRSHTAKSPEIVHSSIRQIKNTVRDSLRASFNPKTIKGNEFLPRTYKFDVFAGRRILFDEGISEESTQDHFSTRASILSRLEEVPVFFKTSGRITKVEQSNSPAFTVSENIAYDSKNNNYQIKFSTSLGIQNVANSIIKNGSSSSLVGNYNALSLKYWLNINDNFRILPEFGAFVRYISVNLDEVLDPIAVDNTLFTRYKYQHRNGLFFNLPASYNLSEKIKLRFDTTLRTNEFDNPNLDLIFINPSINFYNGHYGLSLTGGVNSFFSDSNRQSSSQRYWAGITGSSFNILGVGKRGEGFFRAIYDFENQDVSGFLGFSFYLDGGRLFLDYPRGTVGFRELKRNSISSDYFTK